MQVLSVRVIDAYNYIYTSLLKKKQYLQTAKTDIFKAYEIIRIRLSSVKRELKTILQSDLFLDYCDRMNLNNDSIFRLMCNTMRDNWIEHVITVPNFGKDNRLLGAHIIFFITTVQNKFQQ